ncbi:MAG: hypothetical protein V2A59_00435 [Candidatus Omnitrophota bacterium]
MSILLKKGRVLLYFLALIFIPINIAQAQLSFRIDPARLRIAVSPGGTKSGTIKVYTQSAQSLKVKVYLEDWDYADQTGTRAFHPANTTPLSCASWISLNPSEFIIPAYGVGQLNYTIKAPADIEGGHFAVMFFETEPIAATLQGQTESVQANTTLNIRLGALFYVEAQNNTKRSISLSKFSIADAPKNKGIIISGDFQNIGNTDITAGGTFYIMNSKGKIFARGNFNDVYTLPQDKAKLSASLKDPLTTGRYSIVISLDLGKAIETATAHKARGPIVTKEAEIEIGENGEVLRVGDFK